MSALIKETKIFNLNGVNVELPKEKLQEMLKEFDNKPKWKIVDNSDNSSFDLKLIFEINGKTLTKLLINNNETIIAKNNEFNEFIYEIAKATGDLITDKEYFDNDFWSYGITFDNDGKLYTTCYYSDTKNRSNAYFKTAAIRDKVYDLLKKFIELLIKVWKGGQ